jgi:thromboxane-A synthase
MILFTGTLVALLLVVFVAYLWHIRRAYDFFVRLGIPGPPPIFFFGNFLEIIQSRRVSMAIKQWTDKYGRIFGYFEGHTPILVVSDPDILQDVFIKSFSNFHSRRHLPLEDRDSKQVNLFSAIGLRWKRQRFVLNPTFSSAKLKQMSPLMDKSVNVFMKKMAEQHIKGEPFDIYAYFKRFTMDTIWSCGFGLDTNMQNDVNDPYLVHSQEIFKDENNFKLLILLDIFITELKRIWKKLHDYENNARYWLRHSFPFIKRFINEEPSTWILKQARTVIEKREQVGQTNRTDLLQIMLESASNEDFIRVYFVFS